MSKDLSVSLSIQLKQTDAKARIAEIGKELQRLGTNASAPAAELEKLRQKLLTLKSTAKLDVARNIIGVEPFRNAQREIDKVNAAFARLKTSGKLSAAELGQAYLKTQQRIEELKGSMNGLGAYFEQIRTKALALAANLAVFGLAAREAIQFEDALVDVRRAANTTATETADMGREIKDLAEQFGMSSVAMAGLVTAAGKMGVAKADLMEFARVAATAALNFDMIPEDAGEALGKLKNIFKLSVGDMEAFVAAINELADSASASEREVIEALKGGGGDVKMFGLDPKQAAALATGFISVGATAEQAGTAMRTLVARLSKAVGDSGKAGKALRGVVGDTRAFAQIMAGDANAALMLFLGSLSKLPSLARAATLRDIFEEGLDTSNIGKLANDFSNFAELASHAAKSDDELVQSLRELTAMKLGTTQQELNLMAAAWRNAGSAVGELFLPAIRGATIALAALAKAIRYMAEEFPWLTRLAAIAGTLAVGWGALRGIWTVLVAVLAKVGINLAKVTTFSGLLVSVGTKVWNVFRSIGTMAGFAFAALRGGAGIIAAIRVALGGLMGPIGWIVTGLSLLATAWDLFGSSGDEAKEALEKQRKAFDAVATSLRGIGDAAADAKNQLDVAVQNASAPIAALQDDYKQATAVIKTELDARLQVIDEAAKRETALVEQSNKGQQEKARETARIALQAEQQKAQAVEQAGQQMLTRWEQTYGRALAIEKEAGIKGTALAKEAVAAKLEIYKELESGYRATIDKLIAEEQRHLQASKDIEQDRLMLKMSVEDKLRALSQKTMTDEAAYADKVNQINEKIAAAREASAQGQTEMAKRYADEAISLAQSNANAVTQTVGDAQQTVVSLEQAVQTSSGQIQQAYQVIDQSMQQTAKDHQAMAQEAGAQVSEQQAKLDELKAMIEEIRQQQAVEIETKLTADEASATEAIAQLQRLADAQAVQVKLDMDLQTAQAALTAWKQQPGNQDLQLKASLSMENLTATAAQLKTQMAAANLQVPAGLDTTPAHEEFAKLQSELEGADTTSQHHVDDNVPETMGNIESLNNHNTSSTHTIYVRRVETNATGGPVGWAQRLAAGGQAWRRIVGAVRGAGTSTSDSIRAMLSNGEYVIKASSVKKYGLRIMDAINRGVLPLAGNFASGGHAMLDTIRHGVPIPHLAVGGAVSAASMPSMPGSSETMTVMFRAGESEMPVRMMRSDKGMLQALIKELNRVGLTRG